MPMIDKPAYFCREYYDELWDALEQYVTFIEQFGVEEPEDCVDLPLPTNDEIEDESCLLMCRIVYLAPVARCIIPISAHAFIEVGCAE